MSTNHSGNLCLCIFTMCLLYLYSISFRYPCSLYSQLEINDFSLDLFAVCHINDINIGNILNITNWTVHSNSYCEYLFAIDAHWHCQRAINLRSLSFSLSPFWLRMCAIVTSVCILSQRKGTKLRESILLWLSILYYWQQTISIIYRSQCYFVVPKFGPTGINQLLACMLSFYSIRCFLSPFYLVHRLSMPIPVGRPSSIVNLVIEHKPWFKSEISKL